MELDTQERKRNDQTLFKFIVKSAITPILTEYALVQQKWLIEDQQKKLNSVDGIGPSHLIRNKMPHCAFKHTRKIQISNENDKSIASTEQEEGLIVFSGTISQNILIPNWLDKDKIKERLKSTVFLQKDLKIPQFGSSYDFAPFLSKETVDDNRICQPQLQCIMGCSQGNIYVFDPNLMQNGKISRFYYNKAPCQKKRRVEIVKWLEPLNEEQNVTQFIVVYEDGTFYVFDSQNPINNDEVKIVSIIEKDQPKDVVAETVVALMQQSVENYDFNKNYLKKPETLQGQTTILKFEEDVIMGVVQTHSKIYNNRACNIIVAKCSLTNPQLIFRYDVRQINDIATLRVGQQKQDHWIIAACNDGYLKVFGLQKYNLIKVIKGLSGNPICLDVAGTGHIPSLQEQRDIMAVGYEDDSFIVYSILNDFQPMYRGQGHRAFISSIKFDNYFLDEQLKYSISTFKDQEIQTLNFSLKRSKAGTILDQVQCLSAMRQSIKRSSNEREYRIITGGEDGSIMWWNFIAPYPKMSSLAAGRVTLMQSQLVVQVVASKSLIQLKPVHSIHLSENAQFYGIIIGPQSICFAQNDCILSFYTVNYLVPQHAVEEIAETDATEIEISEYTAANQLQIHMQTKKFNVWGQNTASQAQLEDEKVPSSAMPPINEVHLSKQNLAMQS